MHLTRRSGNGLRGLICPPQTQLQQYFDRTEGHTMHYHEGGDQPKWLRLLKLAVLITFLSLVSHRIYQRWLQIRVSLKV
jgi:hypothetical protein